MMPVLGRKLGRATEELREEMCSASHASVSSRDPNLRSSFVLGPSALPADGGMVETAMRELGARLACPPAWFFEAFDLEGNAACPDREEIPRDAGYEMEGCCPL